MHHIYRTHNIIHTMTTPYTPYANGKVENGIGLIKTLTRTMLISSGLTKTYWYIAARYATYIAKKSACVLPRNILCGRNITRRNRTS